MIDLGTLTTEELADFYLKVNAQKQQAEAHLSAMKEELAARGFKPTTDQPVIILGTKSELKIRMDLAVTLDQKKIRSSMPAEWVKEYETISPRTVVTAKERKVVSTTGKTIAA